MIEMGFNQSEKMRSLQHRSSKSSKEKGLPSSETKNAHVLEKVGTLKTERLRHEVNKNSGVSPLGNCRKPWRSRNATGIEGPIKNMSNVPYYLQRKENGDNIHEKALNFGVLDWGLLERWAYHQRSVTDVGGGDSASSSTMSSTFSTFGSSNQSCRTMSSSRGKKSPSAFHRKKPPVLDSSIKMSEKESSAHTNGFCGSRTSSSSSSSSKFPVQHERHSDADFCLIVDHKLGTDGNKNLDSQAISSEVCVALHSATSPSGYKIDDSPATKVVEDQNSSLMKAEMPQDYPHSLPIADDMPWLSLDRRVRWDYLRQSVDGGCLNSDSPLTSDGWLDERNGNNYSGSLAEDVEIIRQYPHVPHSCPLPRTILKDEPDISCTLPSESSGPTDKLFPRDPCKKLEVNTIQESRKSGAKAMAVTGKKKKSSDHPTSVGLSRMSRSCSLKEGSSEEQFETISYLYNSQGDQATRNNKSRQSPLRRILDPLFKPKNNLRLTGIAAALPGRHSCELSRTVKAFHGLHKPSKTSVDSTCKGIHQDEKHMASVKQAFLQLAWENGYPSFIISSCDSEVLAATTTMTSVSNDDGLECIYKLFSIKDSKKKSMFWSNPVSKGKKHQLTSNVVGQLRVSLCKLRSYQYDNSHVVREFNLFGAESTPTSHKPVDNPIKSELAAVVVNLPLEMPKSTNVGDLRCSEFRSAPNEEKRLQTDRHDVAVDRSGVSVILPSGVHGLSTDGEPSPLIERWRSGGACDCGGWDEGCKLTILSDKLQECTSGSFQDRQTTDRTYRFELFIQGGSQEKRHAFSMVSFGDGRYAVDYLSSISLLQAFAICIAIHHGRKPDNYSAEPKSFREHDVCGQSGRPLRAQGDHASYVPNHPPLSPVGRA
ncbi:uncharacterized protein LOC135626056 [Musa acuminata AAA Group]|uniref:uncharacterized protein LOC135626056 n=1 Tax=Musa acuminata AAA Group TaxID=214697 RepID=UPI0031D5C1B4